MGVWEGGWQTGDTIGLIVWFILLRGQCVQERETNFLKFKTAHYQIS
jgi:hypothetical protein